MNDHDDAEKLEGVRSYVEQFIAPWVILLGAIWFLSRLLSCCAGH